MRLGRVTASWASVAVMSAPGIAVVGAMRPSSVAIGVEEGR